MQGIALVLGLGEREGILLALVARLHLGGTSRRGIEEAAHAPVLGRKGDRGTVGSGHGLKIYTPAVPAGGLEGDTVAHTHDKMASLGEENDVQRFGFHRFGTLNATSLVHLHPGIVVVALLLGCLIYGEHAREAAVGIEVEHRTGVGPHLVVAAGIAQHTPFGIGLLHRSVHQGERAMAATLHHPELLLAQHHTRGGKAAPRRVPCCRPPCRR